MSSYLLSMCLLLHTFQRCYRHGYSLETWIFLFSRCTATGIMQSARDIAPLEQSIISIVAGIASWKEPYHYYSFRAPGAVSMMTRRIAKGELPRDLDNSYPRQLVPKTTRTQDNSYPRQLVPKKTRTQDNSYPWQFVLKPTRTQDNLYPRQLVPMVHDMIP